MFLSVSRHISHSIVCVFHFQNFSVFFCHIPGPTVCISYFPPFSVLLAIFQVLQCVFLIFYDFQYSRHSPGLQCEFMFFHVFQCFRTYYTSYSVCNSFSKFFSVVSPYSRSYSVHFSFSTFLSVFRHIPGPTMFMFSVFSP